MPYPVTPPGCSSLRALACFKICWESSDKVRPFDHLDIRQTRYIENLFP
jgi:hypothetical protein